MKEPAGPDELVPVWHQGIGSQQDGRWQPVSKQFIPPKIIIEEDQEP